MSLTDYIVDIALIAVVVLQMRTQQLTWRSMLLPLAIVAWAGQRYLQGLHPAGNDLVLVAGFTAVGMALGTASGLLTGVWRDRNARVLARAGVLAAAAWVVGMGFRFAFAVYANTASGGEALHRFSAGHGITSGAAWSDALVLMAFAEVVSRVAVLQVRRLRGQRLPVLAV